MQEPRNLTSVCALPQVVRALTVMLHRQWLTVRRTGGPPRTDQQKRTVRCLRDTVLLLHSLSQKDKLFSVHCVEVLHQYDQVMPGVSMLIRGLPDVTDCEGELAGGPLPAPALTWAFSSSLLTSQTSPPYVSSPPSTTAFASTGVILVFLLWFFSEHIRLPFAYICCVGLAEPRFFQKHPCLNCLCITLLAVTEGARPGRGRDWLVPAGMGGGEVGPPPVSSNFRSSPGDPLLFWLRGSLG